MAHRGVKHDVGKIQAATVMGDFSLALTEVCKVGTYGISKYSKGDWLHVSDAKSRYDDAMMRHWLSRDTEECDPESNLMHQAHVAWNALAVLELMLRSENPNQGCQS